VNVLILTRPDDGYAWHAVAKVLTARGVTVHPFDTHRFPGGLGLTWNGFRDGWLDLPTGRLALADIDAIWCRRLELGRGLPSQLSEGMRRASTAEAAAVLMGALADTDAFWLDPPHRTRRARNKAYQLRVAREVGIDVPRTLETNDPREARAFIAELGRPVIAKMYNDARFNDGTVYTNVLSPDDIDALDALRACPMILQEAVDKRSELRVALAGQRLFAVELPHDGLDHASRVDWRRTGGQTLDRWRTVDLPPDLEARLQRFYGLLGVHYSSTDLVHTPDGRMVLLESNVVGESFWIGEHHPLPEALADVLMGRPGARRPERAA
jgi:hypothetical protein